ncbi:ImmA/IrrE family metallo-endopeptidase [Cohnella cholangitidis]|uniref:ImmA/IrrE family metallo-endopeptidase n=1 Tax=Cohnella cholangitidis TaxID=2598458 RepID=A0A7G5C5F2_9BACL|nr:ImmA/IrrE family metallo-endopeptidase [Cohnella cholangitidis]QMV44436.1 ImmA/IrrE family metallo-endopeptidase [Cohnella cholangitidis]
MLLDKLLEYAHQKDVTVQYIDMPITMSGLYGDGLIWLNKGLPTRAATACALGEELGHHNKTVGDILDQTRIENRKQERRAREWGHDYLLPLSRLVDAYHARIEGRFELSEYLGVTEDFLQEAIDRLKDRHGIAVYYNDYLIIFDPLQVYEPYSI